MIACAPRPGSDLRRLEALPAGVRVFGVEDAALPLDRLEFLAWRAYRGLRDMARTSRRGGSLPAPGGGADAGAARPDWLDRSEVRWRPHPRTLLRAYWAWLEHARYHKWARRAVAVAKAIVEPGVHAAVITSGPPHMTHDAGRAVSQLTGLPFVMDMRDPWSLSERVHESVASPLWFRLARRYERVAVGRAALIVANTEAAREALAAAYPRARGRLITVMNGSDEDPLPRSAPGHRFTIAYAGTIYLERHPRSLFAAVARVIRELGLTPMEFGVEFMGGDASRQQSLIKIAGEQGIANFVAARPARPHAEALELQAQAAMLVTFPGWDTITIPAKIFECVRFEAWLLALADPGSATERLLQGTGADVTAPNDIAAMATVIRRRYEEYRRGVRPCRAVADDRFSRRRQGQILLDAMARILPG